MQKYLKHLKSIPGNSLVLVLFFVLQSFFGQVTRQDPLDETVHEETKIWFSTIPNERQDSLEPYYKELKKATFGVQRFSLFDQLAEYHIEKGNTDSILHYGNLYVKEILNWDKPVDVKQIYLTKAYYILAIGSKFNGLLDNAITWHFKGITAAENTENTEYEYKHKLGLGKAYNLKKEYEKSIETLTAAIVKYEQQWPGHTNEAMIYLGDAYYSQGAHQKAIGFYEKARKGSQALGELEKELFINLKLGLLAEDENRYDDAFALYEDTRNRGLAEGLDVLYFEGTIRLGNLFYKDGNYEAAIAGLSTAYVNAIERENLHYQEEILDIQRKAFSKKGDYQNAYAVMTQLANIRNRINTEQQRKISKELEVQYETLQKEKEILTLQEDQIKQEAELKRQHTIKNAFLIGFLIILIPIIALLFVYYQKIQAQSELAKTQEEINEQKVTALEQEQELNLIKAAIEGQDEERKRIAQELHDSIGGNLAGIKLQLASLTKGTEEFKTINGQLDETYQLVRDISHTLIPSKFKENAFTDLIRQYTKSITSSGELEVGFHPHPEEALNNIAEKTQMELFKIVQELMTNTLKHADATQVDIHLSLIENDLSFLFEDNGKGFETETTSNGIGFESIKNRLSELSGILHIDSVESRGTVISIEIPNA